MAPNVNAVDGGAMDIPHENHHHDTSDGNGSGSGGEVPVSSIAMKLLDLRLKPSTAIITSVSGSFTGVGHHEVAILRSGGTIEIYRIIVMETSANNDEEDDEEVPEEPQTLMKLITRIETRSILRSCVKVRYPGETRDVLAVTSDSGAVVVLDFALSSSSASASSSTSSNRNTSNACRITLLPIRRDVRFSSRRWKNDNWSMSSIAMRPGLPSLPVHWRHIEIGPSFLIPLVLIMDMGIQSLRPWRYNTQTIRM
jgi:hypothetical protein